MKSRKFVALVVMAALAALIAIPTAISAFAAEATVTVTGEVIDSACYIKSGAKGAGHADCATGCAKAGIPLAILEDKTDKVWMVISDKDAESANGKLMPFVAKKVTVSGTVHEKGGQKVLEIKSVKAA